MVKQINTNSETDLSSVQRLFNLYQRISRKIVNEDQDPSIEWHHLAPQGRKSAQKSSLFLWENGDGPFFLAKTQPPSMNWGNYTFWGWAGGTSTILNWVPYGCSYIFSIVFSIFWGSKIGSCPSASSWIAFDPFGKGEWIVDLPTLLRYKIHHRSLTATAPEKWGQRKTIKFQVGFGNLFRGWAFAVKLLGVWYFKENMVSCFVGLNGL